MSAAMRAEHQQTMLTTDHKLGPDHRLSPNHYERAEKILCVLEHGVQVMKRDQELLP